MPAKKKKELEVMEEEQVQETVEEKNEEEQDLMVNESGEELLYPGGPTLAQVEEWKSQYGEVFLSEFDEDIFIWRILTRKEYKDIMKIPNSDSYYKEERFCEKAVIHPADYSFIKMSNGKAGIPTLLSEYIMQKSGFEANTAAMRL